MKESKSLDSFSNEDFNSQKKDFLDFQRLFLHAKQIAPHFEYSDSIIMPRSVLNELLPCEQAKFQQLVQSKLLILELKPLNHFLAKNLPFKLKQPELEHKLASLDDKLFKLEADNSKFLPKSMSARESVFQSQSTLYSQGQLCWLRGFVTGFEDHVYLPKWLANAACISLETGGAFLRQLKTAEVNQIGICHSVLVKPITPNFQILANTTSLKELPRLVREAMEEYKLLWNGKILKVQILQNLYLFEVLELNRMRNSGIFYNEIQNVEVWDYDASRYQELRERFDLFEIYDFSYKESENLTDVMDADQVLQKIGLNLEEMERQKKNLELLKKIKKDIRQLNILEDNNPFKIKKSYSDKFFQIQPSNRTHKSKMTLRMILDSQYHYHSKNMTQKPLPIFQPLSPITTFDHRFKEIAKSYFTSQPKAGALTERKKEKSIIVLSHMKKDEMEENDQELNANQTVECSRRNSSAYSGVRAVYAKNKFPEKKVPTQNAKTQDQSIQVRGFSAKQRRQAKDESSWNNIQNNNSQSGQSKIFKHISTVNLNSNLDQNQASSILVQDPSTIPPTDPEDKIILHQISRIASPADYQKALKQTGSSFNRKPKQYATPFITERNFHQEEEQYLSDYFKRLEAKSQHQKQLRSNKPSH